MDENLSSQPSEPSTIAPTTAPVRTLPVIEAAHPEIALLLGQLDLATTHWRNEMLYVISDQFPEGWGRLEPTVDQIVWPSFPGGHSIGAVLLHMAAVEVLWCHEVAAGWTPSDEKPPILLAVAADQEAVDHVRWPVPPREPLSWYLAQLDAVRARTKELLRDANPDDIKTRAGDAEAYSMRWLLGYTGLHESYHGGQCVLLSLQSRASSAGAS